MTRLASALAAEAVRRAEAGDIPGTLQDIEAIGALARHLRAKPDIELFTYSLLADNTVFDTVGVLFRDRAFPMDDHAKIVAHDDYRLLARPSLLRYGDRGMVYFDTQYPEKWFAEDKADFARTMAAHLRALRRPYLDNPFSAKRGQPRWASYLSTRYSILMDPMIIYTTEARSRLLRVAMDLRAWHAEHGNEHGEYPTAWTMPTDPLSGKPLEYRRAADGFYLWSRLDPSVSLQWN